LRDGRPLPAPSLLDTGTNEVDARALARWGLDESNLPAGTNIRFAEPSIWREHRNWILAVCAAIILQSILITGLIYEHRRRRLAEVKERLRIKELALMNRRAAIGQMSASIAHEIKQPLSAILANSDVALHWLRKQTPDTAEISSAVESIAEDTLRANNIIDSVRAMFKNDDTLHDPLDINAVLRDVLTLLRVELIEHKIILRLGLQNDIAHMPADRAQMQQVFLNLIRNAIEAMQQVKDRPRQLRILSGVTESKEIVVTIEDNGQGVAPDVLARLFEPFVTTKGSGMGMGLSICRSIIESHGGHLSARAAMPHGAVFEITLPLPHND
jgi:C4-dicarboxylate-specific signal transduction histidine kinase